jgi:hypothetical protein
MRANEIMNEQVAVADLPLFEMANLRENRTGIPGTVYISTAQGEHGARVKYFAGRAGNDQPSFSVTISLPPRVEANSLPEQVENEYGPLVKHWVELNYQALLNYWNNGTSWYEEEVDAFKAGLKRIPTKRKAPSQAELEQTIGDAVTKRDWTTAIRAFKQLYGGSFRAFWNQYSTQDKADETAARAAFSRFRKD